MAKQQYIHVRNLEKYVPSYTDRAYSWAKFYCRDTFDKKSGITYRSILDDPEVEQLDEINRYRFLSLVLREVYMGRPVPLDDKNIVAMGWDLQICPKARTLRVLHKLTEVLHTSAQLCNTNSQNCDTAKRSESEAKETKGKESEAKRRPGKGTPSEGNAKLPDGPPADGLAPDFPARFAGSLRTLVRPRSNGDHTTLLNIATWVQEQIRTGADQKTICLAVLERAQKAEHDGTKPMALFQHLLQDDLGYRSK